MGSDYVSLHETLFPGDDTHVLVALPKSAALLQQKSLGAALTITWGTGDG